MVAKSGFIAVKWIIRLVQWFVGAVVVAIVLFFLWLIWASIFFKPMSGVPGGITSP